MRDERGIAGPGGELAQHLFGSGGVLDVAVSHSGVAFDERRDRAPWSGETRKRFLRTEAATGETHRRDLDEFILLGIQTRGFQIVDHKAVTEVLGIRPEKRVLTGDTNDTSADRRLGAAQEMPTCWTRNLHRRRAANHPTDGQVNDGEVGRVAWAQASKQRVAAVNSWSDLTGK